MLTTSMVMYSECVPFPVVFGCIAGSNVGAVVGESIAVYRAGETAAKMGIAIGGSIGLIGGTGCGIAYYEISKPK